MAKEHPVSQVDQLQQRILELQTALTKAQERVVDLLESPARERSDPTGAGAPVNYNSPDFDDMLNRQMDEATIVKGILSQVYYGRVVSIQLMGSGAIEIKQQSHHLVQAQTKENKYVPMRVVLSHETFFMILEAMKYAEEKFNLDRKAVIDKLTAGDELRFREAITII
jgi:hypothetical protein